MNPTFIQFTIKENQYHVMVFNTIEEMAYFMFLNKSTEVENCIYNK